mmetsp:Transcript_9803/g.36579  ORF Transcript_9803/g.36579 Transcript_9803/m.36579 type:complete len:84 (-) Transcript_9803:3601-3852(-)
MRLEKHRYNMVCPNAKCRNVQWYLDATNNTASYNDEVEITKFTYKKLQHLLDKLKCAQGKDNKTIPEKVYQEVAMRAFHEAGW